MRNRLLAALLLLGSLVGSPARGEDWKFPPGSYKPEGTTTVTYEVDGHHKITSMSVTHKVTVGRSGVLLDLTRLITDVVKERMAKTMTVTLKQDIVLGPGFGATGIRLEAGIVDGFVDVIATQNVNGIQERTVFTSLSAATNRLRTIHYNSVTLSGTIGFKRGIWNPVEPGGTVSGLTFKQTVTGGGGGGGGGGHPNPDAVPEHVTQPKPPQIPWAGPKQPEHVTQPKPPTVASFGVQGPVPKVRALTTAPVTPKEPASVKVGQ